MQNKTSPDQLIEDARNGKLKDDFMNFVHKQINDSKAGSYVIRFKKVITSWIKFNGFDPNLEGIKVRGANISPTILDESVPQKDELSKIIRMATPRGRAIIGLMAFSGLRPESLGNYDGSDGIRVNDIEGLRIDANEVDFNVEAPALKIRQTNKAQLSEKGHSYTTFIP